jgi:hypothetical protein
MEVQMDKPAALSGCRRWPVDGRLRSWHTPRLSIASMVWTHARCGVGLDVFVINGEIEKHRCDLSEEMLRSPSASEGLA